LGKLEKECGNIEEARYHFELLLNTKNDSHARFELGKLEKESGHLELARKHFELLLNMNSDQYARLELGKLEKELGNIALARKHFEALLNNKSDSYARLELGKLEKELGNIKEARRIFQSLINSKNDIYARLELGKLEKELGNIKEARRILESLLNSKNGIYARLELGKLEKENGNRELARKHFEFLLNNYNDDYDKLELGQLEFEDGNIELSKEYLESLITRTNSRYAIILLITLHIKCNSFTEALKLVNKAIKSNIDIPKPIILFLSKQLNIDIIDVTEYWYTYRDYQLLDYDEYTAIENIVEQHQLDFSEDIDIYYLFNNVNKYLISENKINKIRLYDTYLIPYPNCGKNGVNYLSVVTLPNSKEILTMFPCSSAYDIEEDVDDIGMEKVKKYNK